MLYKFYSHNNTLGLGQLNYIINITQVMNPEYKTLYLQILHSYGKSYFWNYDFSY